MTSKWTSALPLLSLLFAVFVFTACCRDGQVARTYFAGAENAAVISLAQVQLSEAADSNVAIVSGAKATSAPLDWAVSDSATTWSAQITMPRGSLSGLCVVRVERDSLIGALINEFGVQAFDFHYDRISQKLRLQHLIPPLNRFFLRRVIRRDVRTFAPYFATGRAFVHENRHGIRYEFSPLPSSAQ